MAVNQAQNSGGGDAATQAAVQEMQQTAVDNAVLTGANAQFQGKMQTDEVMNNAMTAATAAAARIGTNT